MSDSHPDSLKHINIAFVRARWHADIVDNAYHAFVHEASSTAVTVDVFDVPGALEIPLHTKMLVQTGRYDAIVGCAFVVDGGIYRHDFVAGTVLDALMAIQLAADVPVFSLVLTPHAFHETEEHRHFFADHFVQKGREVATTCLETLAARELLRIEEATHERVTATEA